MEELPVIENECRRKFCKEVLLVSGLVLGGAASTILSGCETDVTKLSEAPTGDTFTIDVSADAEMKLLVKGQGVKRTITQNGKTLNGGSAVIIIKVDDSNYRVFTSLCTHERNPIIPPNPLDASRADMDEGKYMWCPTHNSFFDPLSGSPISEEPFNGPAKVKLREFPTTFTNQILTITG